MFTLIERVRVSDTAPPFERPSERAAFASASGLVTIDVPEPDALVGGIGLTVIGGSGETLGSASFAPRQSPADLLVATPREAEVRGEGVAGLDPRMKLVGRIVDVRDSTTMVGRTVALVATAGTAVVPIGVARTEPGGTFTMPYPLAFDPQRGWVRRTFEAVHARIAGARDPSGAERIEIPLDVHADGGALPIDVLLLVVPDMLGSETSDCGCEQSLSVADPDDLARAPESYAADAGRCVSFSVPNRSTEEFSYHTVLRITDPLLTGRTPPANSDAAIAAISGNTEPQPAPPRTVPAPGSTAAQPKAPKFGSLTLDRRVTEHGFRMLDKVAATLDAVGRNRAGRLDVSAETPIQWDSDTGSSEYEASEIAIGHLLQFKQVWRAAGYSLGDLLYSLPLAPGQKRQVAVLDWRVRDEALRSEETALSDSIAADLVVDRDITTIVDGVLKERTKGSSSSTTMGAGHGSGVAGSGGQGGMSFGALGGTAMAGGYSEATSEQNSTRSLAATEIQRIRESTVQSASAVRNQRNSVVVALSEGQTASVTTDVVANHNHCHALTIQYFEVLRHFIVTQELAAVRECLLVPLPMSDFDAAKALRWRDAIGFALRDRSLLPALGHLDRVVANDWTDLPPERNADQSIEALTGHLIVELRAGNDEPGLLERLRDKLHDLLGRAGGDTKFSASLGVSGGASVDPALQFTAGRRYALGEPIRVSVRANAPLKHLRRSDVESLELKWTLDNWPDGTDLIIRRARIDYRAETFTGVFIDEDCDAGGKEASVKFRAPMSAEDKLRPRLEIQRAVARLIQHLNQHVEYYHKAIWWQMDPDRRFMLLDGFVAPFSGSRSVASVTENRLMGFIGNSMVLPVAFGFQLNPAYRSRRATDSLEHLYPAPTPVPMRISLPTQGVFAEAVMGKCDACETIDENRFWRWNEVPTGDEPTPIQSPSVALMPSGVAGALTPTPLPGSSVGMQATPTLPDPSGMQQALQLLGTANAFRDATGLTETQKNAMAALQATLEAAKSFGSEAAKLATSAQMQKGGIDKSLQSITQAQRAGLLDEGTAKQLTATALQGLVGGPLGTGAAAAAAASPLGLPGLQSAVQAAALGGLIATTNEGKDIQIDNRTAPTGNSTVRSLPAATFAAYRAASEAADEGLPVPQLGIEIQGDQVVGTWHIWDFAVDSADIPPVHYPALALLGGMLQNAPDGLATVKGRASQTGTDSHNQDLSKRRADEVVEWLALAGHVPRSKFRPNGVVGVGITEPLRNLPGIEERVNRSVGITFRLPKAIGLPKQVRELPPLPRPSGATKWAISLDNSLVLGEVVGAGLTFGWLRKDEGADQAPRAIVIAAAGLVAEINLGIILKWLRGVPSAPLATSSTSWTSFTTAQRLELEDFSFRRVTLSEIGLRAVLPGYSTGKLTFRGITLEPDGAISLGGFSYGLGASIGGHLMEGVILYDLF